MSCSDTWLVSGRRVVMLALTLVAAGCGSGPTTPSYVVDVPFSSTDVVVGTGAEAVVGKVLVVDYAGWLYNGSQPNNRGVQFDNTTNGDVFPFQLGTGAVISGWEQGVPGMRVGGMRRLIVPPDLAYGSTGNGPIPANATLVFEIVLYGVFDPGSAPQSMTPGRSRPPL
jgi:FKBP-type peptidyl-prolyl cis-trans isomerase FkpA